VSINPITTILGGIVLWVVIILAILDIKKSIANFTLAQKWITDKCTW